MTSSLQCIFGNTAASSTNLRIQFNLPPLNSGHHKRANIPSFTPSTCLYVDVLDQKNAPQTGAKTKEIMEDNAKVIVGTYDRALVVFFHDKGYKLFDVEGQEYLDLTSRISINALGHSDPDWVRAVSD